MGLVGADEFLRYVELTRYLWISGRFGGGKTALAFEIAGSLIDTERFTHLYSNCASVWADDPSRLQLREGLYADSAIVLDEAGLFVRDNKTAQRWLAFLRKFNIVLILPSFAPPAPSFQNLRVRRLLDGGAFGLPFWLYGWKYEDRDIKEGGRFFWWQPADIFGTYDTQSIPSDADELLNMLDRIVNERLKSPKSHTKQKSFKLSGRSGGMVGASSSSSLEVDTSQLLEVLDKINGGVTQN
jgi:hypothetical protein